MVFGFGITYNVLAEFPEIKLMTSWQLQANHECIFFKEKSVEASLS